MNMTIFTADTAGVAKNCLYPNRAEITNTQELAEALSKDHTCGEFKGNYRSISNFIGSGVIAMDFDNTESEDSKDWVTPQKIAEMMPDVAMAIAPSRNNMKPKDGKAPRPKGHVYFDFDPINSL